MERMRNKEQVSYMSAERIFLWPIVLQISLRHNRLPQFQCTIPPSPLGSRKQFKKSLCECPLSERQPSFEISIARPTHFPHTLEQTVLFVACLLTISSHS